MKKEPTTQHKIYALMKANPEMTYGQACFRLGVKPDPLCDAFSTFSDIWPWEEK